MRNDCFASLWRTASVSPTRGVDDTCRQTTLRRALILTLYRVCGVASVWGDHDCVVQRSSIRSCHLRYGLHLWFLTSCCRHKPMLWLYVHICAVIEHLPLVSSKHHFRLTLVTSDHIELFHSASGNYTTAGLVGLHSWTLSDGIALGGHCIFNWWPVWSSHIKRIDLALVHLLPLLDVSIVR